jgi:Leucine-rich repeat (LRR) protein
LFLVGPDNEIAADLGHLAALPGLEALSIRGITGTSLNFVASLPGLLWLQCSGREVSDLGPLAGLTALQALDCSHTRVSGLGPLFGLTALQSLDCSFTPVSALDPLAGLTAPMPFLGSNSEPANGHFHLKKILRPITKSGSRWLFGPRQSDKMRGMIALEF